MQLFYFFTNKGLQFGVLSGGTLHEVAHVIAASATAGSDAIDMAVIVKLTRVVMLVPVAILFGILENRQNQEAKKGTSLPIPWFIVGFLVMSTFRYS
nr:putative sulfate exporter family transporter [Metabacillus crassostreae]